MVNKTNVFHSSANSEELQQNHRIKLFFTSSCGNLSQVSSQLFKEINKKKSSKLPRPGSFLLRVLQEIKYEPVSVAYNLMKIEKQEVAN